MAFLTKKIVLCLTLLAFLPLFSEAQSTYKPKKKRKDFFGGPEDFNDYKPWGVQVQLGGTYTFTRRTNPVIGLDTNNARYQYTHDPAGRLGIYAELGLAKFNMRKAKTRLGRAVDYFDFGVGYKLLGGRETTTLDQLDAMGNVVLSSEGEGKFYNGYVYGRFAVHKLIYLNKTKNYFFDNALGVNLDYLVTGGSTNYTQPVLPQTQKFAGDFVAQLHYGLGFGIRIKRGKYLIPGIQIPLVGIQDWNGGRAQLDWYSSRFYPMQFQIKYIQLLVKKSNGCNTGSEEDRKRNEQYLQGR